MTSQMLVKADEPKTNTIKGQLKLLDGFGSQHPRPTYRCSVDLIEFNNKTTPKEYRHHKQYNQKTTEEFHLDNKII